MRPTLLDKLMPPRTVWERFDSPEDTSWTFEAHLDNRVYTFRFFESGTLQCNIRRGNQSVHSSISLGPLYDDDVFCDAALLLAHGVHDTINLLFPDDDDDSPSQSDGETSSRFSKIFTGEAQ